MQKKVKEENQSEKLQDSYKRWQILLDQGGQDPTWSDGCNINLVRGHIMIEKTRLEEELSDGEFPEEYYWPLPPVMPDSFIARSREIWYHALKSYQTYKQNENYKYLCQIHDSISEDIRKKSCIDTVTGYADGLKRMIEEKDFVGIRRHENPARYLESFSECRKRIGEFLLMEQEMGENAEEQKQEEQLDLFHVGLMEGKRR